MTKYGYTANVPSTYHLMILVLSDDRVKTIYVVPFKYFTSLVSFFESLLFGFFNMLHNTAIVGWMSDFSILN